MNKIIGIFIGIIIFGGIFYTSASAQTTATSSTQELIQSLKTQIEAFKTQIAALNTQLQAIKQTESEIKTTLRLIKHLRFGASGDDVKLLQEILATDSEIYPEGLVTGYFGRLTERAVKMFQKKMGVEQVGLVGPKTLAKINEILEQGAGNSGKVPPGLLIAPGIREKLGFAATTTPDTTAPVISEVTATSTIATSTTITWITNETADSYVWYDVTTPLAISTSTPAISSSNTVLNHELSLSDLAASTTYYYVVTSADAAGNRATSSESFFTTLSSE